MPALAPRLTTRPFRFAALFFGAVWGHAATAETTGHGGAPELKLKHASFAQSNEEISGAVLSGKDLLMVSDNAEDHFVYRAVPDGNRFTVAKALDLTRLDGYSNYVDALKTEGRVPVKDRRIDFEGITACGDKIYMINERVRQVLVIEDKKRVTRLAVDFSGYAELFGGGPNAGFEGLAVDCATNTLYVAKEREPRQIFVIDLKTLQITKNFDVPSSDRAGQRVINPFTAEGLMDIGPDFADLAFDGGYLYAIERNTYEIAKIDPKTFEVVARRSYYKTEKPLYETGEPFGAAEALSLTADEITIGIDNNQTPLTHFAKKTYGVKGKFGALLVFERPKGF